jgi:hypothetical protein
LCTIAATEGAAAISSAVGVTDGDGGWVGGV